MEGQENKEATQEPGSGMGMVDVSKLGQLFEEKLQAGLKVFGQEQQESQQRQQQEEQTREQQRQVQEAAQKDAFGQVLAPYIGPVAQSLKFQADDTKDYVKFYTENPGSVGKREAIEAKFQELARAGRPTLREDINAWFVGREKMAKDQEAATQAALQASTINSGLGQRDALGTKSAYEMTKEERLAFLGSIPF